MTFDIMQQLFWAIAALGGGFFGAAIGGNFSFVITGFTALMALGGAAAAGDDPGVASTMIGYLSFGPFIGPHVAFGGAAAAAAYAAKRGYTESGKDIVLPLARLGKPDVLLVGAMFGIGGHILQQCFAFMPWWGTHTDSVALTVLLSNMLARVLFGKNAQDPEHGGSLINAEKMVDGMKPREGAAWLRFMETPSQLLALGLFTGLAAAGGSLYLAYNMPGIGLSASAFPWAISAVTIFFLNIGYNIPVSHHMTILGGLGAIVFFPLLMGVPVYGFEANGPAGNLPGFPDVALFDGDGKMVGAAIGALIIGGLWGVIGAFFGEWAARIFYNRGTTHIDPPAISIWAGTTLIWIVAMVVQMAAGIS